MYHALEVHQLEPDVEKLQMVQNMEQSRKDGDDHITRRLMSHSLGETSRLPVLAGGSNFGAVSARATALVASPAWVSRAVVTPHCVKCGEVIPNAACSHSCPDCATAQYCSPGCRTTHRHVHASFCAGQHGSRAAAALEATTVSMSLAAQGPRGTGVLAKLGSKLAPEARAHLQEMQVGDILHAQ
jgi:hypothetical protein